MSTRPLPRAKAVRQHLHRARGLSRRRASGRSSRLPRSGGSLEHHDVEEEGAVRLDREVRADLVRRGGLQGVDRGDHRCGRSHPLDPRAEVDPDPVAAHALHGKAGAHHGRDPLGHGVVAHVRRVTEKLDRLEVRVVERASRRDRVDEDRGRPAAPRGAPPRSRAPGCASDAR